MVNSKAMSLLRPNSRSFSTRHLATGKRRLGTGLPHLSHHAPLVHGKRQRNQSRQPRHS
jgi:hypothetical protein